MIFLIDYDRRTGRLVSMKSFVDECREQAQDQRLELELDLARSGIEREIVLLEASDEDALRQTHGRYFYSASELASQLESSSSAYVVRETKE